MLSLRELLAVFPQAKPLIRGKIAECKKQLTYYRDQQFLARTDYKKWSERESLKTTLLFYDHLIEDEIKLLNKYEFALKPGRQLTGQITDADIAQAKTVPIESLYEGRLRKVGNRLTGKCPFHTEGRERTPSFVIYVDQNSWWCYACSFGGSAVDYIMRRDNVKFLEAVKVLIA